MDRIVSDEERLKRAQAVAERRKNKNVEYNYEKIQLEKDKSKSRKILLQIFVCLLIYCGLFYIKNSANDNGIKKIYNEKISWILDYDINFKEMYSSFINKIKKDNNDKTNNIENNNDENNNNENMDNEEISSENLIFNYGIGGELNENNEELNDESSINQDVDYIKSQIKLSKPIEQSVVTSRFGSRESSTIVSSNHKGIDLGAANGTEIKSASDGKVIEVSSSGDFGKHIKIQNGEVTFIYAHCSNLFVNNGDEIKLGQKIAEVGATGRATGPHLHFEIRRGERAIDPELVMNFE